MPRLVGELSQSVTLRAVSAQGDQKQDTGEGGIRTLGSLLGYGALAKRCFQPLSHLTKCRARISRLIGDFQFPILQFPTPTSSRARDFIGVANCLLLTEMISNDQRRRSAKENCGDSS